MKDRVLIFGHPATPERWKQWEQYIGIDAESIKATISANRMCAELAVKLKQQRDAREMACV
jgi:hypothetical protein